eukprot:NODE_279_length_1734_cov_112.490977_g250_i0.p1 GENE.NODE_279_length_1734_cov_112.490977_g250_i0~~NODE_279_length_1734_cov_112.490977_g250_i0.p1  ORF type:complete len:550 (-),score=162.28 NODE_279_length_1734_cov_112.490977_g250_i0:24-1673(-)
MKYLVALCLVVAAAGMSPPQWPDKYLVEGSITLRPVDTPWVEFRNFSVYYDTSLGTFTEFDRGLETTTQIIAKKMAYTVLAAKDQYACIHFNESGPTGAHAHQHAFTASGADAMTLQPGLPNMTDYVNKGKVACPKHTHKHGGHGRFCEHWEKVETKYGKTGSYELYMLDGRPLSWEMLGVNEFETSHYDHYVIIYHKYQPGYSNPELIKEPKICEKAESAPPAFLLHKHTRSLHLSRALPSAAKHHFRNFQQKYNKAYKQLDEHDVKFVKFSRNLGMINRHNADKTHTWTMAVNHLADYSLEELNKMKGLRGAGGPTALYTHERTGLSIPKGKDWRKPGDVLSPVKDQGMCGTCWAFSTTGALESAYYKKYGEMKLLSEQFLADCAWNGYSAGCFGGLQWAAYDYIKANGGIPTTNKYGPYRMINEFCRYKNHTEAVNIKGYVNVTSGDEQDLMDAIANVGPVAVSIDAGGPLYFYHDGVYYWSGCKNGVDNLDHAVLAVGYGTEKGQPYWIIKNSWSTFWGDFGYVKMSRKGNNCGVATSPLYPIVA